MTISVWIHTSPSGMPLRFLFAADERKHLGHDLVDDSEIAGERNPIEGCACLQEQLFDLAPDAFGGQIVESNISCTAPPSSRRG